MERHVVPGGGAGINQAGAWPPFLDAPPVPPYTRGVAGVRDYRIPATKLFEMSESKFDAILIDFYGTICAGDREAVEMACRNIVETCNLSVLPQKFAIRWGLRFFDTIDRCNHDAFKTLYECEINSLQETLAEFGENRSRANVKPLVGELEEYWANPPIYPDARAFLEGLDRPVCCVSNADTRPLMRAIERHGLQFDRIITSEDTRCYKPAPAIFRAALDAMGVEPDRVVHIGDSRHSDVGGAARLGIATVWLHRESRVHDIGNGKPDFTIGTLDVDLSIIADLSR